MPIATLSRVREVVDAAVVRRWFRAAREALAAARAEIDALNVYPVPDGDTGTNLHLTMQAAAAALDEADVGDDPAAALQAAARGALLGARGNSGVILSQLLRGAAEGLDGAQPVRPPDLARAFRRAADLGYAAVGQPVEGTILTVARAAADAAEATACAGGSLVRVARSATRAARTALEHTPEQLDVLARAGVVDAGGRGLVVVFEAFDTALTGWRPVTPPVSRPVTGPVRPLPAPVLPGGDLAPGGPAYEVMYLLDADDSAIDTLRARLLPLGDSLVVVGGDGLWNVHVHVDDVGAAVEAGIAAGRPYRIRVTHFADQLRSGGGQPPAPTTRTVVAVAAGEGLRALFEAAGAVVVTGGPGRRCSTAELLAAVRSAGAREAVLLPNDRDTLAVAEAAAAVARDEGVRVAVIPTRAQVQGIAAVAVHEPGLPFDEDVVAMTTAAGHTRHGAVTVAAREAVTSAGICREGDVLGVIEGDFAVIGSDLAAVAVEVVDRMLAAGGELVTVVTGAAGEPVAEAVVAHLRATRPDLDTVVHHGGQERYPVLLGVE